MDKPLGGRDGKFINCYPKAPGTNGKRKHVAIAEDVLGRILPPGAEVHHVDGVKTHNCRTNLVICEDHTYHMLLEVRSRVVREGGDPNTQRICVHCYELVLIEDFSKGGNQCRRCKNARERRRRIG